MRAECGSSEMHVFLFRDARVVSTPYSVQLGAAEGEHEGSQARAQASAKAEAQMANESEQSASFHELIAARGIADDAGPLRVYAASAASLPEVLPACQHACIVSALTLKAFRSCLGMSRLHGP